MKKDAPEGAEDTMHADAIEAELRWLDLVLGEGADPVEGEADAARLAAARGDLALLAQLGEGPELPIAAFIPDAPSSPPPLPAALEASLVAIPGEGSPGAAPSLWAAVMGLLRGRGALALSLTAAAALLFIAFPQRDDGVVKGPEGALLAPEHPLAVHLVRRGGDGRIVRLPVEALSGGGHGARVDAGEELLPVFQSPDVDLARGAWHLYAFVTDGRRAWQLGEARGPVAMDALPGTAHLYAAPEPLHFTEGASSRRLAMVLSPDPLSPAQLADALRRLAAAPVSDGRPRLTAGGPEGVLEGSLRVEVR